MMHRSAAMIAILAATCMALVACTQAAPSPALTKAPAEPAKAAEQTKVVPAPTSAPEVAKPTPVPPKVSFPAKGKAISIIVPFPPGGGTDIAARVLAPLLEKELGVPVQIVNKAGAGAQTGLAELALAKPDGYTVGYTNLPAAVLIYLDPERKATFTLKSFQPVANQVRNSVVAAVQSGSPYKSMKDLIDAAKASPDKIKVGTPGVMSPAYLGILQLQEVTGAKFRIVNFEGGAPLVTALLGGQIDVGFPVIPEILSHSKSGLLRVLGIMDDDVSKLLPDAKTMASQGYQVSMPTSLGISAPAGTPREIVDILSGAAKKAIATEEHQKKVAELGYDLFYQDPGQFSKFWADYEIKIQSLMQLAKEQQ